MKHRNLILSAAAVLTALSVATGSMAYIKAEEQVTNVVTVGNVQIDLTEPNFDAFIASTGGAVMPASGVPKDPTVENIGTNDAYLLVQAQISWGDTVFPEGTTPPALPSFDDLGITVNSNFTPYNTDTQLATFVYNPTFSAGATTPSVFNAGEFNYTMTIPHDWEDPAYMNAQLTIDVTAKAIQADNLTHDEGIHELGFDVSAQA